MTILDHWQSQREQLPARLHGQDLSGIVYHLRHALLQTEQNALAEMQDDILRQQAGMMFSCVKQSIGLLDVHTVAQIWRPAEQNKARFLSKERLVALCIWLAAILFCGFKSFWLPLLFITVGLCFDVLAFVQDQKHTFAGSDAMGTRITVEPDLDRLLGFVDGQLRSVDRYLTDFRYLNEQIRGVSESSDPVAVSRAADMLEALYDCDDGVRDAAMDAATRLLESLGLKALDYSEENSRFFNALPSKNTTRTLSPAILSVKDFRLLRRGTAAVKNEAA